MAKAGVTGMPGKEYLRRTGRLERCQVCPYLRACWNAEEYEHLAGRGTSPR
jgi:hypothetical protein